MSSNPPTLHILGAGAIGHLLACYQTLANKSVILIEREPKSRHDIQFVDRDGKTSTLSLDYIDHQAVSNIERLIVTVKSHQLNEALNTIAEQLHRNVEVLILCNGMGNLETAVSCLSHVKPENIFIGINTHGCYLETNQDKLIVRHSGQGAITYGQNFLNTNPVGSHDGFQLAPTLKATFKNEIQNDLWLKLAINAVINPLTAIHQCRNGHLLENDKLKEMTDRLIAEINMLYAKLEIAITPKEIESSIYEVITATGANYSSMYMDIKNKKKTEIDAISGYLLHCAYEKGFLMQDQQYLFNMIKNIEQGHKFDN